MNRTAFQLYNLLKKQDVTMLPELPHKGKSYLAELIQRHITVLLDMSIAYIVPFKNATTPEMLHILVQEGWLQTSYLTNTHKSNLNTNY